MNLYLFFSMNFADKCLEMSSHPKMWNIILKFVLKLLSKGPVHNCFNSFTPYSFRFVQLISTLNLVT